MEAASFCPSHTIQSKEQNGTFVSNSTDAPANAPEENIFEPISGERHATEVNELSSLCMNCGAQGITRLLLASIPHFRDVVISSFSCELCSFSNRELLPVSDIQDRGVIFVLQVRTKAHLNLQVVRSQWAQIEIPALEFEMPAGSSRGSLTTVEGLILKATEDLGQAAQNHALSGNAELATRLTAFVGRLRSLLDLPDTESNSGPGPQTDFTASALNNAHSNSMGNGAGFLLRLRDPSGNSFISGSILDGTSNLENGNLERQEYVRSAEDEVRLGLVPESSTPSLSLPPLKEETETEPELNGPNGARPDPNGSSLHSNPVMECEMGETIPSTNTNPNSSTAISSSTKPLPSSDSNFTDTNTAELDPDLFEFHVNCPRCSRACHTRMTIVNIPHFRDIIIMATTCQDCGYRENQVQSASSTQPLGVRYRLRVERPEDLKRDVVKSDTCAISITELDLQTDYGTLGAKYTTVEGLLRDMHNQLSSTHLELDENQAQAQSQPPDLVKEVHSLGHGASAAQATTSNPAPLNTSPMAQLLSNLESLLLFKNSTGFELVLDDPAGNSFVQSLSQMQEDNITSEYTKSGKQLHPVPVSIIALEAHQTNQTQSPNLNTSSQIEAHAVPRIEHIDERLQCEHYERDESQCELLGLNDMRVEHYQFEHQENSPDGQPKHAPSPNSTLSPGVLGVRERARPGLDLDGTERGSAAKCARFDSECNGLDSMDSS